MNDSPHSPVAATPPAMPSVAAPVTAPVAAPQPTTQAPANRNKRSQPATRQRHPLLATLAQQFPKVFGPQPLPLKVGAFDDLQASMDGVDVAALKLALAQHTRSNGYLQAVAGGQPRHNLQGEVVEAMAAGHVFHALTELLRRRLRRAAQGEGNPANTRQRRDAGDAAAQWQWFERRLRLAIEHSGSPVAVFAAAAQTRDAQVQAVLARVVEQLTAQAARQEAMLAAFEAAGGSSVADFADTYGLTAQEAGLMLARARMQREARTENAPPSAV